VLLDFGGVLDGYCLDLTRMVAVPPLSWEVGPLFDAVSAAHAAAIAAVRPGVPAWAIDRAAREVLEARGYGAAFVHGTGHGLGLEVHEAPRIGKAEEAAVRAGTPAAMTDAERPDVLQPGMVCTIEPGAYLEGQGGVRLEDDILVTTDGCDVLTTARRDLLIVGTV
jgi:Xaa-Pro aminopeptidase